MKQHAKVGAALSGLALVGTSIAASPATAATSGPIPAGSTPVNLLTVNDFHGRIDDGKMTGAIGKNFACTMISQRDLLNADSPGSTLTIGAGDLINASPLASALQDELPSLDFLGAIGLQSSAVGNHEFDDGFDHLTKTFMPRAQAAGFEYLGANVYRKGTTTPAIKAYETYTVNGITVGIVGAVTAETPNLVSGTGVADLDFGDPVEGVNRVIDQLSDGNIANDEADVIVATYHEGGPYSSSTGSNLADQMAVPVFKHLVNDTSPKAAAIVQGHTHQAYVYNVPVPGATDGSTRPVLQTGNYAANVGKIQFGVDPATKKVVGYNATNVSVTGYSPTCAANAQWQRAASIVDAAVAYAKPIADQKIGSATAPITRAFMTVNGKVSEDRGAESTLGNLIAQQYLESVNGMSGFHADLGIMNPGGIRDDIIPAADGSITYGQAALVLPFNNTLKTAEYTGAQVKSILEEQWQPSGLSRPYLQLGLSKNTTYTYDPNRPKGDRITSIRVNGAPIDAAGVYTIASGSFLVTDVGAAPDNFATMLKGKNYRDTLYQDTAAFVDWVKATSPISPSYAKHAVAVVAHPTPLTIDTTATFEVQGLDMTSVGSPSNTSVDVYVGSVKVGTYPVQPTVLATPVPVRKGNGTVSFYVSGSWLAKTLRDAGLPPGSKSAPTQIRIVAPDSGTESVFPVTIQRPGKGRG
ncbi:MAG: bifunctional metallophosphatase/5'-nucleotidase [Actinobacteria bacterium]|jgi:5''-nucleotidase/2'',3''-cyclic phosphodiesterase and related esterases|nr:bifunctional metallophosphatase/5'-nucleotidase [Actinomycetota bacterium]